MADTTVKEAKSAKIMLALILGLPVVRPSWVDACEAGNARQPYAKHFASRRPGKPWMGLRGKRAYIHGRERMLPVKTLLKFAGALSAVYQAGGGRPCGSPHC